MSVNEKEIMNIKATNTSFDINGIQASDYVNIPEISQDN